MTVSHVKNLYCLLAFVTITPVTVTAQLKTGQDPNTPLPSVNVGAGPSVLGPKVLGPQKNEFKIIGRELDKPAKLKILLNPKTREPLTNKEIKARKDTKKRTGISQELDLSNNVKSTAQGQDLEKPKTDVEVRNLRAIETGSVGLLEKTDGGFGENMWLKTPRSLVFRLLQNVPMSTDSPTMRAITRRVLLSSAHPPTGDGRADLLSLRIRRLVEGGWYIEASQLLKQLPPGGIANELAVTSLNALLLKGNVKDACKLVRNRIEIELDNAWEKTVAFCLAVEGKTAHAELYEQLLYENDVEDSAFFKLLGSLTGRDSGPLNSLGQAAEPLHLSMLRAARKTVPEDAIVGANPAILRAIATSPNASLELRLKAAETAHKSGLLNVGIVRRIYASVKFTAEERAEALEQSVALDPAKALALLYQVAQIDSQPMNRALVIQLALKKSVKVDRHLTVADVNLENIQAIEPEKGLAWFAEDAGRALILLGEFQKAKTWLAAVLGPAKNGDVESIKAVLALTPLIMVIDPNINKMPYEETLRAWWMAEKEINRQDRFRRAAVFFGILEILGVKISEHLWDDLVTGPSGSGNQPAPGLLSRLNDAVSSAEHGKAILLALMALGKEGPKKASVPAILGVVRALHNMGLVEEARAIGIEAMLGVGF